MELAINLMLCSMIIMSAFGSSQSPPGNNDSEMTYMHLFSQMEKMEETFQYRLRGFQEMTDDLKAKISSIHDTNKELLLFITEQGRRISNLENEKRELERKVETCNTKIAQLVNKQLYDNETIKIHERRNPSDLISFHATLTRKLSVSNGQHLSIDQFYGDGYDGSTFTAPSSGNYVFTATVLAMQNKYVETEIVKNGASIAKLFSGGYQYLNSGSNTVVVSLHHGDKVWLRVIDQWHDDGVVIDSAFTTFAGFRLLY